MNPRHYLEYKLLSINGMFEHRETHLLVRIEIQKSAKTKSAKTNNHNEKNKPTARYWWGANSAPSIQKNAPSWGAPPYNFVT